MLEGLVPPPSSVRNNAVGLDAYIADHEDSMIKE